MKRIIYNSMELPDGTVLVSRHRHDCVTHTDEQGRFYMLDGGLDYVRYSDGGGAKLVTLYDDEPHNVQREVLTWGTYGKNGDQPLKLISIKDMETDHIEAVLNRCMVSPVIKNCMKKELEERINA